jgi:hypothetical protein
MRFNKLSVVLHILQKGKKSGEDAGGKPTASCPLQFFEGVPKWIFIAAQKPQMNVSLSRGQGIRRYDSKSEKWFSQEIVPLPRCGRNDDGAVTVTQQRAYELV